MTDSLPVVALSDLGLNPSVVDAAHLCGYESATPIQAQAIPLLLEGRDVIGQAQTGTGKTAAFALPLLSRIQAGKSTVSMLVLTPTRELAVQVSANIEAYSRALPGLRVVTLYGGADYRPQLSALRAGVDVVVGTPGRVMDHMRRGTLSLSALEALVLDEADEMLRMGFVEAVEWILAQTPPERQIALFSATMPPAIRRIAQSHLRDPAQVTVKAATATAQTIRQRVCVVPQGQKFRLLTQVLEVEEPEAVLIFVRTKDETVRVSSQLVEAGFRCAPLNGDIVQRNRERTVEELKSGELDIVVGTDVAARGLDVARITHVINYDFPEDPETYVHRIGRTGRAGKQGEAILFVTPAQQRRVRGLEQVTRHRLERFVMPPASEVNARRMARMKLQMAEVCAREGLEDFEALVQSFCEESGQSPQRVAAAFLRELRGPEPLFLREDRPARAPKGPQPAQSVEASADLRESPRRPHERPARDPSFEAPRRGRDEAPARRRKGERDTSMERYRIEVGTKHGAEVRHIVGAIANEAGLQARDIGKVVLHETYSVVDLPEGMPREILRILKRTWVADQQLRMTKIARAGARSASRRTH